jgi:hypothetical protein
MKTIFTTTLLIFFFFAATAQDQSNAKPKSKMKNAGIILTSVGVPLLAGGIALGINTGGFSYEYNNTNGYVTEKGEPINGLAGVMTMLGGLSTGGGIVLAIIGHNQIKKQKGLTINFSPNKVYLCYKF